MSAALSLLDPVDNVGHHHAVTHTSAAAMSPCSDAASPPLLAYDLTTHTGSCM